jgi:hypothetical protein
MGKAERIAHSHNSFANFKGIGTPKRQDRQWIGSLDLNDGNI